MSDQDVEKLTQNEDELSLIDIVILIRDNFIYFGFSLGVACLLGFLYWVAFPNYYEAIANVQSALIAGKPVEETQQFYEKIRLPNYFSVSTRKFCGSGSASSGDKGLAENIKIGFNRSAPFVTLTATASSKDQALNCLKASLSEIMSQHEKLIAPQISLKQHELNMLQNDLTTLEEINKRVLERLSNQNNNTTNDAIKIASNGELDYLRSRIRELKNDTANLEQLLSPPQTQPASLVTPILEPQNPINKNPVLVVLFIIVTTIAGGFVWTFANRLRKDLRSISKFD